MPVETSGRHYQGPEQPKQPPMPAHLLEPPSAPEMPSADELQGEIPDLRSPVALAFEAWFEQRQAADENPAGVMKLGGLLEEAFLAGWQAAGRVKVADVRMRMAELPLEGTLESRTIIAALELFKSQVLVENPPEVQSGEWLNARDVDVLIQGIRATAAKGR